MSKALGAVLAGALMLFFLARLGGGDEERVALEPGAAPPIDAAIARGPFGPHLAALRAALAQSTVAEPQYPDWTPLAQRPVRPTPPGDVIAEAAGRIIGAAGSCGAPENQRTAVYTEAQRRWRAAPTYAPTLRSEKDGVFDTYARIVLMRGWQGGCAPARAAFEELARQLRVRMP